jgi:hypothetical protein
MLLPLVTNLEIKHWPTNKILSNQNWYYWNQVDAEIDDLEKKNYTIDYFSARKHEIWRFSLFFTKTKSVFYLPVLCFCPPIGVILFFQQNW